MKKYANLVGIACLAAALVFSIACGDAANTAYTAGNAANNVSPANSAGVSNAGNAASSPAVANANTAASAAKPFSKTVEMHGIKFTVESPNSAAGNKVTVTPSRLEATNEAATKDVDGVVYDAEVGDLNVDQSPEVYIYVRENGGNKRAMVVGYSANNKKSMSEITVPAMDAQSKDYAGFNGEDEFRVVESTLVHRFPLFEGTGAAAQKTGKTRQIQYKIKQGEAAWQLYPDKVTEY